MLLEEGFLVIYLCNTLSIFTSLKAFYIFYPRYTRIHSNHRETLVSRIRRPATHSKVLYHGQLSVFFFCLKQWFIDLLETRQTTTNQRSQMQTERKKPQMYTSGSEYVQYSTFDPVYVIARQVHEVGGQTKAVISYRMHRNCPL